MLRIQDLRDEILQAAVAFGFDPEVPEGTEEYLAKLVGQFEGSRAEFRAWFGPKLLTAFPAVQDRPRWVQEPEWPLLNGEPMLFLGQVEPHDPSWGSQRAYFLFSDSSGQNCRVVTQYG